MWQSAQPQDRSWPSRCSTPRPTRARGLAAASSLAALAQPPEASALERNDAPRGRSSTGADVVADDGTGTGAEASASTSDTELDRSDRGRPCDCWSAEVDVRRGPRPSITLVDPDRRRRRPATAVSFSSSSSELAVSARKRHVTLAARERPSAALGVMTKGGSRTVVVAGAGHHVAHVGVENLARAAGVQEPTPAREHAEHASPPSRCTRRTAAVPTALKTTRSSSSETDSQ